MIDFACSKYHLLCTANKKQYIYRACERHAFQISLKKGGGGEGKKNGENKKIDHFNIHSQW